MKVWITKYALTEGIFEVDAESKEGDTMISYKLEDGFSSQYAHGEGREWCATEAAAKERAEDMRKARIASLHKSIAKLEKLRF